MELGESHSVERKTPSAAHVEKNFDEEGLQRQTRGVGERSGQIHDDIARHGKIDRDQDRHISRTISQDQRAFELECGDDRGCPYQKPRPL